jgi:hypothetical protein
VGTSDQRLVHIPDWCCTELPKTCNYEWGMWIIANTWSSGPPTWSFVTANIFFAETTTYRIRGQGQHPQGPRHRRLLQLCWRLLSEILAAPPKGLAIEIFFNLGGGCYRRYQQHPEGAPSSMSSSTSVMAATGDTNNTARGLVIDVFFNFGGGCCQRYR